MAGRKYEIAEYEDFPYELHGTKADGKSLGFAPVPHVNTVCDMLAWIICKKFFVDTDEELSLLIDQIADRIGPGKGELMVAAWKHGHCIKHLQAPIRDAASGKRKMTKSDFSRIGSTLDLNEFMGDFERLQKVIQATFDQEQTTDEGEDLSQKIWWELL
jgi:hypothetical protein